jgi:beta-lactamase class A
LRFGNLESWGKMSSFKNGLLLMTIALHAYAFATADGLKQNFQELASQIDGRLGICALDTKASEPICINGDHRFSLQSVMKLVTAAAVMDAIDRKQMQLSDIVAVRPENASPGPQEFANMVRGKGILNTTVEDLIQRAVVDSDSTSVDILIERLGGVAIVQNFLKSKKIEGISIDRNERHVQAESQGLTWRAEYADSKKFEAAVHALPDEKRDLAWNAYLKDARDTATPAGMVGFLKALATGKLLSQESTNKLLAVMAKTQTGRDRLMAGTPKNWSIGHKTGTSPSWKGMAAAINDVGILTAPDGGKIAIAGVAVRVCGRIRVPFYS